MIILISLSCTKEKKIEKITLAEGMQPICAPVYVADQMGFFNELGLDVQLIPFSKGKLCLDAVLGGKADLGTVAETPLMHIGFQKQPVSILATIHTSTQNTKCVARKDHGILNPSDIKGHNIGVPIGGNAEYFMDIFLNKYGLTRKNVNIVNLNPPEMVGAIVRGDIDVSFSWEPHITRTVNQLGDKVIVFLGDDLYRETFNLVCLNEWAKSNQSTCEKVLKALIKATTYIQENQNESINIVANHIQMDNEELASIWHYYTFKISLDKFLLDALNKQAKWAIDNGIQEGQIPDYCCLFYTLPLKKVAPKSVTINY